MKKRDVLKEIEVLSSRGELDRDEVLTSFEKGVSEKGETVRKKSDDTSRFLYYLGALIAFVGIAIYVGQAWDVLFDWMKVLLTLGVGVLAYIAGTLFWQRVTTHGVGNAFHLLAIVMLPLGMFVLAYLTLGQISQGLSVIIFLILACGYIASFFVRRTTLFLLFSIFFTTALFFSLVAFLVSLGSFTSTEALRLSRYSVFVVGLSYAFLGYFLSSRAFRSLSGFFYGAGAVGFLGTALLLGGWTPEQNIFWEIIYPFIAFGTLFLSLSLRSRTFLVFGAIFLFSYIFKITAEYFSGDYGWSLSLVILGFIFIAIGYLTVFLGRKIRGRKLSVK